MTQQVTDLYKTDQYIINNPTLHEEDTPFKLTHIYPLIDKYMQINSKNTIKLLDVGGGAGLILKETANYIESHYNVKVTKYSLDLSPGMLQI